MDMDCAFVVSDGSVKNFILVTWHPAGLRGAAGPSNIVHGMVSKQDKAKKLNYFLVQN